MVVMVILVLNISQGTHWRAIVSLLVVICQHGKVRSQMLYLNPMQNQNIDPWHSLIMSLSELLNY